MNKIIFHGSPCQDFSIAGKGKGGEEGSGTRSSLLWHTVRIVKQEKPKYVIWENVKAVISKKHRETFDKYLEQMEELGYTNHYQVCNAKDYGIPQNRDRVFTISILDNKEGNCDVFNDFTFPPKQELKLRLKDMLEDEVDEKYYIKKILNTRLTKNYIQYSNSGKNQNSQAERLYYQDSFCPTLSKCNSNGDKSQIILETKENLKEYKSYISWEDKKGRINTQDHRAFKDDMYSETVPSMERGIPKVLSDFKIRKLTPLECWRLMGFDDDDFHKAQEVNSNTQLYKQAGNSIVVNVLEAIFENLFNQDDEIELIELFGGIGAPRKAMTRLGLNFKVLDYVEIDKYAVLSYNAIYGENYDPKDITEYGDDTNE